VYQCYALGAPKPMTVVADSGFKLSVGLGYNLLQLPRSLKTQTKVGILKIKYHCQASESPKSVIVVLVVGSLWVLGIHICLRCHENFTFVTCQSLI
jgi:hypothetical protein